jgi:hypothetical protein
MRRRLLWLAIVLPATFYLLRFASEGLPACNAAAPPPAGGLARAVHTLHWLLKEQFASAETNVSKAVSILLAMALGLGLVNLFSVHGAALWRRRAGWSYSLVVVISFVTVFSAMLWQYGIDARRRALERSTDAAWGRLAAAQHLPTVAERDAALAALPAADWELIRARQEYCAAYRFEPRTFYVNAIRGPLEATVMSLLGFYLTYAAYRAFRIRSVEATVMMLSAAVVILGSDAFGNWLTGGWLARAAEFDNGVLNSGMQRGLSFGISIATIAVSLRILLGLERGIVDLPAEAS